MVISSNNEGGSGTITNPEKIRRRRTTTELEVEATTSNSNYYSHHCNNNHNPSNENDNDIMYERKMQYMTDALPKHFLALLQLQKSKQNVLTANHSRLPAGNEYRNKSICFIQTGSDSNIMLSIVIS